MLVDTDVSDEGSVRAMVDRAYDEFGQVDILVNKRGHLQSALLSGLAGG